MRRVASGSRLVAGGSIWSQWKCIVALVHGGLVVDAVEALAWGVVLSTYSALPLANSIFLSDLLFMSA